MEEPRRLGGRYELGGVLGRGGMAEVYLGHDIRLGRAVAVKTLRADMARDPSFQARFRREAQSAASLNHPSIVAVYDTGEDYIDGVSIPYIVMEYVDGSTLRRRYHSTLDAAGLRRPRFHDLRHTYGSLLAAAGVDLVTIKSAMDHSALAITGRHLHARPASEQA